MRASSCKNRVFRSAAGGGAGGGFRPRKESKRPSRLGLDGAGGEGGAASPAPKRKASSSLFRAMMMLVLPGASSGCHELGSVGTYRAGSGTGMIFSEE